MTLDVYDDDDDDGDYDAQAMEIQTNSKNLTQLLVIA